MPILGSVTIMTLRANPSPPHEVQSRKRRRSASGGIHALGSLACRRCRSREVKVCPYNPSLIFVALNNNISSATEIILPVAAVQRHLHLASSPIQQQRASILDVSISRLSLLNLPSCIHFFREVLELEEKIRSLEALSVGNGLQEEAVDAQAAGFSAARQRYRTAPFDYSRRPGSSRYVRE